MKNHDLKIYINWHIESKSHKQQILRFALNQLIEQKYDLQIIQTLKNAENRAFWQELNIFSNIEIQLVRNVSKFDQKMTFRKRMLSSLIFFFKKYCFWIMICLQMRNYQLAYLLKTCCSFKLLKLLRLIYHFLKDQLRMKMTTRRNANETWTCNTTKKK
jgi:hypothetical protein